jgi:hypothetical protein
MPHFPACRSFIFRRCVYAMQAHLEGRKLAGLREAEDFSVPRNTKEEGLLARG